MRQAAQALAKAIEDALGRMRVRPSQIAGQLRGDQVAPAASGSRGTVDRDDLITISSATPQPLGTAAPGTVGAASDAGHIHAMPTAGQVGAEPALGNPGTDGYVLSSTALGVRSWVAQSGGGGVSDGDKGDITVSSSGTVWTIDAGAVSYAKIQDVSAASRLLGRGSAGGSGDVEEITLGSGLSLSGTTLSATGAGGGVPMCLISTTEDVPNNSTTTLSFDSEHYDTDGMHSTSIDTSRITIQSDGVYNVNASVSISNGADTAQRYVDIRLNGSTVLFAESRAAYNGDVTAFTLAGDYSLSAGDYLEVRVFQISGSARSVTARFGAHRVGTLP